VLDRICRDAMARADIPAAPEPATTSSGIVPGRRFDDQSLARVARALTTLYCECPLHVVELLRSLGAFEHYSAQCANRDPSDAELHLYLQRVAGSARAMFEDALVRIARAERVALPVVGGDAGTTG
jgi:MerR family transcriptional regulator, light-induced transcriptional regulator